MCNYVTLFTAVFLFGQNLNNISKWYSVAPLEVPIQILYVLLLLFLPQQEVAFIV